MKTRLYAAMATAVFALSFVVGCGNGQDTRVNDSGSGQSQPAVNPKQEEPVKLLLAQKWSEINEADFNTLIVEPLQKKYPHIQVEMLKGENIKEMIAAGTVPDIIATWVNLIPVDAAAGKK